MPLVWFAAVAFFAALLSPPPVRVVLRVHVNATTDATEDDAARISAALLRGVYADSIVVASAETLHFDRQRLLPLDSIHQERIGHTIIVQGSVSGTGPFLEVRLRLLDLLAKPLAAEDTIRLQRPDIESEFTKKGRAYSAFLAQRFKNVR